jgi:outer membrane biosynthesis protein TonB
MAEKRQKQQTDHEFSLSSGQMVGVLVGLVVIVLLAFVAGLLVGRYEAAHDLYALERNARQPERTTVPLDSAPAISTATKVPQIELPSAPRPPAKPEPKPDPKPVVKPDPKPAPPPKAPVKAPVVPKVTKPVVEPEKEVAPEPPKETVVASTGKYGIQVYAMSTKATADENAANLVKSGYDAWVRPPTAGSTKHCVMIGRFATREEAKASALFKKIAGSKEFEGAYVP